MIKVCSLSKSFNNKNAVCKLDFFIKKGSIYGILGPNGAGKTTTFRMLVTLLKPDSGTVIINNKEVTRDSNDIKKMIGMVSQHYSLQSEMTVWEILELHGKLHSMKRKERHDKIDELLHFANLHQESDKIAKQLSGGMKRKLMLIRAIMHNPEILFLDEPTVGLDPISRRNIWLLLEKLKNRGMTIILTTHYIEEAEKLCDNVLLLNGGKRLIEGIPQELIANTGKYTVEVFDPDNSEHYFFYSHKDAVEFSSKMNNKYIVRKSNLEDVFISINKKAGDAIGI
ncbi:ABC transporter ATP-binding protein [Alkaliphilus peptidifermentans]|uniref:ABC-2 type transport system ATP-binding protein n=1 Tax=Alkaliphilus peptidifermentans DSM 18978 TaxID=1120976 RepID=A0A1G5IJZ9_9FIRM|nr:ATP-binding cassette domain-containing protein [Alkaliphilus peptidifermentans]SCY76030.1 ABC-2 type transport system ATP-binding protein [Alkaliphilus peptidifermentans DSM 18978]